MGSVQVGSVKLMSMRDLSRTMEMAVMLVFWLCMC